MNPVPMYKIVLILVICESITSFANLEIKLGTWVVVPYALTVSEYETQHWIPYIYCNKGWFLIGIHFRLDNELYMYSRSTHTRVGHVFFFFICMRVPFLLLNPLITWNCPCLSAQMLKEVVFSFSQTLQDAREKILGVFYTKK